MTPALNTTQQIEFKTLDALADFSEAMRLWQELLNDCEHSFFQSYSWTKTWLETTRTVNPQPKILMVIGTLHGSPVIGAILGKQSTTRNFFVHSNGLHLHNTGNETFDNLTPEYNEILCSSFLPTELKPRAMAKLLTHLDEVSDWNEIFLSAAPKSSLFNLEAAHLKNASVKISATEKAHYVDLEKIRQNSYNYLKLLSSNKRTQIKRSLTEYNKSGDIKVEEATSCEQALEMVDRLAELHQQEWKKRGEPGAFSTPFFVEFHRKLISTAFPKGNIQVLKIYNDKQTIGYLYNFIYQGNVLFYQCGFNYTEGNNKLRPGITSHYLAIMLNSEKGYKSYDFLAGDAQYKASLSTDHQELSWLVIQKHAIQFTVENTLYQIKRQLRQRTA